MGRVTALKLQELLPVSVISRKDQVQPFEAGSEEEVM